jgi:hypothetical protein
MCQELDLAPYFLAAQIRILPSGSGGVFAWPNNAVLSAFLMVSRGTIVFQRLEDRQPALLKGGNKLIAPIGAILIGVSHGEFKAKTARRRGFSVSALFRPLSKPDVLVGIAPHHYCFSFRHKTT